MIHAVTIYCAGAAGAAGVAFPPSAGAALLAFALGLRLCCLRAWWALRGALVAGAASLVAGAVSVVVPAAGAAGAGVASCAEAISGNVTKPRIVPAASVIVRLRMLALHISTPRRGVRLLGIGLPG